MLQYQQWLATVPPVAIYALVAVVIGTESIGIPVPGEITLVGSALLASQHTDIHPLIVAACAITGAVVGDSAGYVIGRQGGSTLLTRLSRRFPKHFSERNITAATRAFDRWGTWTVFIGRFVAVLRIFAGPLAGVLRMPYKRFLAANVFGAVVWAGGTTAAVYYLGVLAQGWLHRFSWIALLLATLTAVTATLIIKRKTATPETAASPRGQTDPQA